MFKIEDVKDFRKSLVTAVSDESVCKEIKPALQAAINALMQVEFVAFCIADDGGVIVDSKD